MCGIAGFFSRSGGTEDDGVIASAMADALKHRGPDAQATWVDQSEAVALAHTRLAILDLSPLGAQPMHSASGRYVISYNGEIYNFPDLRESLEQHGWSFRGGSDTEVLLSAIDHFGIGDTLQRIDGMFAFAVWDRRDRCLTLARDRVGKKPVYYGWCNGVFLFGSELRALRCHPAFDPEIDSSALRQYLDYGWLAHPSSIYRCIRKLPPGAWLTIDAETTTTSEIPLRFWSAKVVSEAVAANPYPGTYEDAVASLETELRDAVERRLASDVPLGALLSGGIDSTAVVAMMRDVSRQPVKTFCIGFEEPRFNEAEYAAQVAQHLGTDHTTMMVNGADALAVVDQLPFIYDEPFADVSQVPTFLVSRLTREHVTVALSGDGGDELFLGYSHYRDCFTRWQQAQKVPASIRGFLARTAETAGRVGWSLADVGKPGAASRVSPWLRAIAKLARQARIWGVDDPQEILARHFSRRPAGLCLVPDTPPSRTILTDADARAVVDDPWRAMSLLDYLGFLTDDILVKVDRASMAVGLEVRAPLLDSRIAAFAWSLPTPYCVDSHGSGKRILKDVLARYVPRDMTDRPKRGFGVPMAEWLRGPLREWAEDLLSVESLAGHDLLDGQAVRLLWRQHLRHWRNHAEVLWAILMFQTWWRAHHAIGSRSG